MTTLLASDLFPPHIPSATKLETPEIYHGGISLESIVDGNLVVLVDAWLNLALDDKCELHWDNDDTPVKTQIISDTTVQRLRFEVPVGFITNDSAKVFYTVTRFPQQPVKSGELLMWVKLNRPGGEDTDSEPGHSGLKYSLVPDPSKGVDAEMAKGGIRMLIEHYQNIATCDRVVGKWKDEEVSFYPVTREQIEDPDNHPIFVTFTEPVIKRQGSGRDIPVTFRVVDRVGNLTDHKDPWAKFTYVTVDLTERLPAPSVLVNDKVVTVIDLKVLGSSDVTVLVYSTSSPPFEVGDEVHLTWTGTPAEGQPIVVGPLKLTVTSVPGHITFKIPNASVRALGGGSAKAKYQVLRGTLPVGASHDASVTVTGEVSQLQPPTVPEALNLMLDPNVANVQQNGFTVLFDNLKLNANDRLELEVVGRPGDGSVPPEEKVVAAGQTKVEFKIPFSITGANLQRTVVLKYRVISGGQGTPVQSVELKIGELLRSSMPMPKLEGFDGDVLDVGLIKDDTKVLCEAWPFQCAKGCPIWLKYVETFAGGGERVKEQFVGAVHDQGVGLSYLAEVEWLRQCKSGSNLNLELRVGLYSGATFSTSVRCQDGAYKAKFGFDELSDFTGYDWGGWKVADPINHQSEIILVEGEYCIQTIRAVRGHHTFQVEKTYQNTKPNTQYIFSFLYRTAKSVNFQLIVDGSNVVAIGVPGAPEWQSKTASFYANASPSNSSMKIFFLLNAYLDEPIQVDNIRLREVSSE